MSYTLNTDGGARGNPGPAAIAFVLKNSANQIVKKGGLYIGETTNNEAEYKALILGLKAALSNNIESLTCFLDSELVVNQLNGLYKVKKAHLIQLFDEVKNLEKRFKEIKYTHVERAKNSQADSLVNEVLDSRQY